MGEVVKDMVGKWKLESRDNNFEEFLRCRQVGWFLRKLMTTTSTNMEYRLVGKNLQIVLEQRGWLKTTLSWESMGTCTNHQLFYSIVCLLMLGLWRRWLLPWEEAPFMICQLRVSSVQQRHCRGNLSLEEYSRQVVETWSKRWGEGWKLEFFNGKFSHKSDYHFYSILFRS